MLHVRSAVALAALLAACGDPAPPTEAPAPAVPASEATAPSPAPAEPGASARLALWVPCEGSERVLEHPERAARLLATARALGATDLFVQVYRGGRAWYDASLADASPHRALLATGTDPLRALVDAAHAQGLRVHAWVNVLSLATHRDGPLLAKFGPDALQVDRDGRSVLDHPGLLAEGGERRAAQLGTPAVWLDPATPGLAAHLAEVFAELLAKHPELDGLHLDYIRYPDVLPFTPGARFDVGLDFGFGAPARERFRAETGRAAPFARDAQNADAFDDWRRARITEVVATIASRARSTRPGIQVSAAVWAFPSRAYLSLFQDWSRWTSEGLLDFAVPMAYTRDPRLFELLARANQGVGGERTWLGLGSWLFASDPARAAAQLAEARALGFPGVALFSYDALAEHPDLANALAPPATPAP